MKRAACLLAWFLSTLAGFAYAQGASPLERTVSGALTVHVPLNRGTWPTTLRSLGRLTGVPIGAEIRPTEAPWVGAETELTLDNMKCGDALRSIFGYVTDYTWSEERGVVVVRPVPTGEWSSALDTPVPAFAVKGQNIHGIVEAVLRIFDESFRLGGIGGSGMRPTAARKESQARTLAIEMFDVTVRDVLNQIVRQFGNMGWEVSYGTLRGNATLELSFHSHEGWGVMAPAVVIRKQK